jgi:exopolysaccharide biosynthesis polyprenyl glycosylphosphotransferase
MVSDFAAAWCSWIVFFMYRKFSVEGASPEETKLIEDLNFLGGGLVIGAYWWLLFTLSNTYYSLYEKSRLSEIIRTLIFSLGGNILLFFALLLNDRIASYQDYYLLFLVLFSAHFLLTISGRIILLFAAKARMQRGEIAFSALLIGNHPDVNKVTKDIERTRSSHGMYIKAYVPENGWIPESVKDFHSPGNLAHLSEILKKETYDYAILALSKEQHSNLPSFIELLDEFGIRIKIIPELHDILSGQVHLSNVIGALLVDVHTQVMAPWERIIKRATDILVSTIFLLVMWPLYLYLAWKVKRSSLGPVIFVQERIGYKGRPFRIIKFRSMYKDAEANGPRLSHEGDDRITPFGRILRKYRLDELPQFINVLKGDMSLVGPRPERKHFADQLMAKAPQYKLIYKVKPGITSLGMVRFGYASDHEAMVERMQYDLMYIENFSLLLDLRIMIHTVLIILKGRGV